MIKKRNYCTVFPICFFVILLSGDATAAKLAPSSIREATKPLTTRLHEADKVFVSEVVNRKLLKDDWCHADLKVTRAIKGVKVGELIPVVWRPKTAKYDAEDKQIGLAVLKHAHEKRYWLRADTFVDISFADEATHSLGKTDGVLREYVKGAGLTQEDEKIIFELAKKRGINKVAKIKTYYMRPTSHRGISVHGVEQVKGREVSNPMLTVSRKGWGHRAAPREGDLKIGDFWAGKAANRKTTILMVGKKEYRVAALHGLTVDQCESVLKRLQSGKYNLAPKVPKDRLKGIDWNRPKSFNKFGENISITFSAEGRDSGWYSLRISLSEDILVINEAMLAMP